MDLNEFNPYVGPRPFEHNEEDAKRFFGRSQETQEIVSFIFGHPVTLVYAQSGAGKTSLFNAGITHNLEKKGFDVFPLTRVGGVLPIGVAPKEIKNLYIFNALLKLDPGPNPRKHLTKSLAEFLNSRERKTDENGQPGPRAVIFDQFEELFTFTPEHWREQRKEFFRQVVDALNDDPLLRVIFVIREDFLAQLDPYARYLPERLRIRYRLERLGKGAALHAIKDPLINTTREFASGVAERLVKELLITRTVDATGEMVQIEGQYVEPVQLQVVCVTLWSSLESGVTEIQQTHLKNFDVNRALSDFYRSAVESADQKASVEVEEAELRNWFGKTLITPMGTRSTVFRGKDTTGGIPNGAVDFLESRHIIRAEYRAGVHWYELTHDRFIEAILADNKEWFAKRSRDAGNPLTDAAQEWERLKSDTGSLLRGARLEEASSWAQKHPEQLGDLEREFLRASQDQNQKELREQAKTAKTFRRLASVLALVLLFAVVAAIFAISNSAQAVNAQATAENAQATAENAQATAQSNAFDASTAQAISEFARSTAQASEEDALAQAEIALAGNLAAQADSLKNSNYRRALLLGLEAYKRDDSLLTRTTLFQLLQFTPYKRLFGFNGSIGSVSVSPDGSIIAVASCKGYNNRRQCTSGGVDIYSHAFDQARVREISGDLGLVYGLAFHQYEDMLVLATAGCVPVRENSNGCLSNLGQISLWKIPPSPEDEPENLFTSLDLPVGMRHSGLVKTIAFSHDGKILASGSNDTDIILWDLSNLMKPIIFGKIDMHTSFVNGLAFAPDDKTLVSGSDDTSIRLWNISNPANPVFLGYAQNGHEAPVNGIAFSPDGTTFASSGNDNQVILWDWDPSTRSLAVRKNLRGHTGYVTSVAFSPDEKLLASAGFDNSVILWDTESGSQVGPPLNVHLRAINTIAFAAEEDPSNGLYLVSGSDDRSLIRWDLSSRKPVSLSFEQNPVVTSDQFLDENRTYTANVSGQQVDLNYLNSEESFLVMSGFNGPVSYVNFEAGNLRTVDQGQKLTNWMTEWTIDPDTWIRRGCEAAGRNLSTSEWEQYLPEQVYKETCEQVP